MHWTPIWGWLVWFEGQYRGRAGGLTDQVIYQWSVQCRAMCMLLKHKIIVPGTFWNASNVWLSSKTTKLWSLRMLQSHNKTVMLAAYLTTNSEEKVPVLSILHSAPIKSPILLSEMWEKECGFIKLHSVSVEITLSYRHPGYRAWWTELPYEAGWSGLRVSTGAEQVDWLTRWFNNGLYSASQFACCWNTTLW